MRGLLKSVMINTGDKFSVRYIHELLGSVLSNVSWFWLNKMSHHSWRFDPRFRNQLSPSYEQTHYI